MKICLVSASTLRLSGIGRTVLNVAKAFENQGHTVGFVSEYGDCSGDVLWTKFKSKNPIYFIREVVRIAAFFRKFDAILCYDVLPAGFAVMLASKFARKPYYVHAVGTYSLFPKKAPMKAYLMEMVYQHAADVFVLSDVVKRYIEKSRINFSLLNAPVIPPGVEVDFFNKVEEKPVSVSGAYIITVGEVKSRKGHDISLEAFGLVSQKCPELQYVIVGKINRSTDIAKKIQSIIEKYNISNRVHFLEDIDDVELRRLYSHAEFFIMTSRTTNEFIEGFGIVYLEAGLCGVPSIGAYETGAEDAILDEKTGLLVQLNVDSVRGAIERLISDPDYVRRLGNNARENASKYLWSNIAAKYIIYLNAEK